MTLEAHYPLAEDSGSTAYDYSGNERHGSVTGAGPGGTGTVTGPFSNSAYDFDGSDDQVALVNDSSLESATFTVSFWLNADTIDDVSWVGKWDSTDSDGWYIRSETNNSNRDLSFRVRDTSGNRDEIKVTSFPTNEWKHIVATRNSTYPGASAMEIYVDGVSVSVVDTDQGAGADISSAIEARIGNVDLGLNGDGQISNVRYYSRPLSPQEVQALYQAGVQSEVVFE